MRTYVRVTQIPSLQTLAFMEFIVWRSRACIGVSIKHAACMVCSPWWMKKHLKPLPRLLVREAFPEYMQCRLDDWAKGIVAYHCGTCDRRMVKLKRTYGLLLLVKK